jgi:hypothetical protein
MKAACSVVSCSASSNSSRQARLLSALIDVGDIQFFGAQRHRVADPGADDRHLHAVLLQPFQAEPVMYMEHLGFPAIFAVPEAAVGQRAVHIEYRHADLGGAGEDVGGDVGEIV